jgi:hypothetical protein
MCKNLHNSSRFLFELVQILVTLFNLFIKCLILDFQLLKIYQMETFCQFFFFLQDLLVLRKSVTGPQYLQSEILQFCC